MGGIQGSLNFTFCLGFALVLTVSAGRTVCQKKESVCLRSCYNPSTHDCHGNETVCAKGETRCGMNCYVAATQICLNERTVCDIGQILCGEYKCYSPETQNCHNQGPLNGNERVCHKAENVCLYDCYSPSSKRCFQNLTLCELNEEVCNHQCYDPNNATCLKYAPCAKGQQVCGTNCYSPGDFNCFGRGVLCKPGEKACGRKCYSETTESCHTKDKYTHIKCRTEQLLCGHDCYNPKTEECFDDKKACHKGQQTCGGYYCYWPLNETCHGGALPYPCPNDLSPCGFWCYDPKTQICSGSIPCAIGESSCGSTCINHAISGLTCYGNGVMCPHGKIRCGFACYDPNTQTCNETPEEWLHTITA